MEIHYKETTFGFDWGGAKIERVASFKDGSVVVFIKTKKENLEVRITKSGLIRAKWNKVVKKL